MITNRWFLQGVTIVAILISISFTFFVIETKMYSVLIIPFVFMMLFKKAGVRLLYLVMGSLIVFGSENVGNLKVLYLAGLSVVFFISLGNIDRNDDTFKKVRPLFNAGYMLLGIVFILGMVSVVRGNDYIIILRESAAYIILALSPVFATDFAQNISKRNLLRYIILCCIAGIVFYSLGWAVRRGYYEILQIGLLTYMLPAALFSLSIATATTQKKGVVKWVLVSILVMLGMVFSGTRTILSFIAAPFSIVLLGKIKAARLIKISIILLILIFASSAVVVNVVDPQSQLFEPIYNRVAYTIDMFKGNNNIASDLSYIERINMTQAAISEFKQSPLIGVGAGNVYTIVRHNGLYENVYYLDSPIYLFAKFGIIGSLVILIFLIKVKNILIKSDRQSTESRALLGFFGITASLMFLINPFEDKGFGLALTLLMALAIKKIRNEDAE